MSDDVLFVFQKATWSPKLGHGTGQDQHRHGFVDFGAKEILLRLRGALAQRGNDASSGDSGRLISAKTAMNSNCVFALTAATHKRHSDKSLPVCIEHAQCMPDVQANPESLCHLRQKDKPHKENTVATHPFANSMKLTLEVNSIHTI